MQAESDRRVLVLFAHPRVDRSEVNEPLVRAAGAVEGVTLVDLYGEYPTLDIDVDREQARLREHDAIVLQHPLYWYSSPAILKEWQDLVLEHGFAYGDGGTALAGKIVLSAVTCGARRTAYTVEGENGIELRDLLAPFRRTFKLCRMRYLAPFALFSAGRAVEEERLEPHLAAYRRLLSSLVARTLDLDAAEAAMTLNELLVEPQPQP